MTTPMKTMSKNEHSSVFDESFTKKYALSKTLRFELRPVGRTLDHMHSHFAYDERLQSFLKDKEIEDAYQTLKPVFDSLHEEFITASLESQAAQAIDFTKYADLYELRNDKSGNKLTLEEKKLLNAFEPLFTEAGVNFAKKAGTDEKGKAVLKEKGYKVLTEAGILQYIRDNQERFAAIVQKETLESSLGRFEGFFTYFSGFNENRENYYTTKDEKATAVATRVVYENLPKFCDNSILFHNKQSEYERIHAMLARLGRVLEIKDGKSGKMVPIHKIPTHIFLIEHFNRCLSQSQIETYNDEVANANYLINLYNQAIREQGGAKLAHFKTLYKQIGCGKRSAPFFALTDEHEADAQKAREAGKVEASSLEQLINNACVAGEKYFEHTSSDSEMLQTVPDILAFLRTRESWAGLYWSKVALNTISGKCLADWTGLQDALLKAKVVTKPSGVGEDKIRIPDAVELTGLFAVFDAVDDWKTAGIFFKERLFTYVDKKDKAVAEVRKKILSEAHTPSEALTGFLAVEVEEHIRSFKEESELVQELKTYTDESAKNTIKQWLEHALSVTQILKYFDVRESKARGEKKDAELTEGLNVVLRSDDAKWFTWYDAARNFLTKKPQDEAKENKLKLNFENSTLAAGWDVNKEKDNFCVLLRDDMGKTYLAITTKKSKDAFAKELKVKKGKTANPLYADTGASALMKMEYKLISKPHMALPKSLLVKSDRSKYGATKEVLAVYDAGGFKKNEANFTASNLGTIIDFYKSALQRYTDWSCFNFSFSPTETYSDIAQFYQDVERQAYKLEFSPINKEVLDTLVEEGNVYLFEIRNQDSNTGKTTTHTKNLHTIYWEAVFGNAENKPKLNGNAEIFYRRALPAEKQEKITHKGKDIIKNFRFSKEKFIFHVPVTLNFCANDSRINDVVNNKLANAPGTMFLGIDRGEKHLAYYTLVNRDGKILQQRSLNVVGPKDYNALLEQRAGERDTARKSWSKIGTIKELKEGYISQVVREIVDIAVEHGAYIVLENLNVGFKRGRQKIEKSVYQKLELALAKKLNFVVDKKAANGELCSVTKALQLTPPVQNFGDMDKKAQFGIMLYTRANYTSQTDPETGWRKSIYLKTGSEAFIREQILEAFSDIAYDGKDYVFTYTERLGKDKREGREWKLYSSKNGTSLDRFRGKQIKRDAWVIEKKNAVELLDALFVDFDKTVSLRQQLEEGSATLRKVDEHTAWETLRYAIELIQQIRNTGEKGDERNADFLLSPVRREDGEHYDSRTYWDKEQTGCPAMLPSSGDANGAYNIARKGIIMAEHLRRDLRPYISDEEWDVWLSGKKAWEGWIIENASTLQYKKKSEAV